MTASTSTDKPPFRESLVLASATITVICIVLGFLWMVTFFPLMVVWWSSRFTESNGMVQTACLLIFQVLHVRWLWISTTYLSWCRWLALPIRRLFMPLAFRVACLESIREAAPTLYAKTDHPGAYLPWNPLPSSPTPSKQQQRLHDNDKGTSSNKAQVTPIKTATLHSARQLRKIRNRYQQVQRIYQHHNIHHVAVLSDATLNLSQVVPIMWQHEQRMARSNPQANVVVEFVKRFLVITVVPDGVLDCYYSSSQDEHNHDHRQLVAVQLSVQQGSVWHWFMYFAYDSVCKSGIWFHGVGINWMRAQDHPNIHYCNGQVHQTTSKQHAGFLLASPSDMTLLHQLYPWSWTVPPLPDLLQISFWGNEITTNEDQQTASKGTTKEIIYSTNHRCHPTCELEVKKVS